MAERCGEDICSRVADFVRTHRLCRRGDRILLACSGGSDSAALLEIFWRLQKELGIGLEVAMVDHRQSAAFRRAIVIIKNRCRRRGLAFRLETLSCARPGLSETELRRLRYRLLSRLARQEGFQRVATGHSRDDQAETVLLRILRGTSAEGLAGIAPRRGVFIRPLLVCGRQELREYLERLRLRWWEDPANLGPAVPRNRVRLDLLPWLEQEFNPRIREALLRLAGSAERLRRLALWAARRARPVRVRDRWEVDLDRMRRLPEAARAVVIRQMAVCLHPQRAAVELSRIEQVLRAIASGKSRFRLSLGGGRECYFRYGRLVVAREGKEDGSFDYSLPGCGELQVPEGGARLRVEIRPRRKCPLRPQRERVFFDADRLGFPLQVRSLRRADRFLPWGSRGEKKVARLLLEAKIPREDRWRVPLLVWSEKILWVAGVRRSRLAPVTEATRRVLMVELLPLV